MKLLGPNEGFKIFVEDESLMPAYAHEGDAGFDLRANIASAITLQPGQRVTVPTGLYTQLPFGTELQIRPRSGHAHKDGITVVNAPGTIDCTYRKEIGVILLNTGDKPFEIKRGDRIAQGVVAPIFYLDLNACLVQSVSELGESERDGGFGHTGAQ